MERSSESARRLGEIAALSALTLAACSSGDWGRNATDHRYEVGSTFDYACPANGPLGAIWGTGVYTDDSDVCTAAVHAGVITRSVGGAVTIEMIDGQSSYCGSTRNGVTSRSYGAWLASYEFPAVGAIDCSGAPPPSSCSPACGSGDVCVDWGGTGYACGAPCATDADCGSGCCAALSSGGSACAPSASFCSSGCRCPDGSACAADGTCPSPGTCHDRTACVRWDNTIRHGLVCGSWGEADASITNDCSDTVHCRFCYDGTFMGLPCGNFVTDIFTIGAGGHVGSGIDGVYACYESAPPTAGAGRYVCVSAADADACLSALP